MALTENRVAEAGRGKLTGWHVLAMFVAFFGVIIAVNVTLAWKAISTFPGVEVEGNGYVASQSFDRDRAAQEALGWRLAASYDADLHVLRLDFKDAEGRQVVLSQLEVLVGRPTESAEDVRPEMLMMDGAYQASVDLGFGKWMMAVDAVAPDGTKFHQRLNLQVRN